MAAPTPPTPPTAPEGEIVHFAYFVPAQGPVPPQPCPLTYYVDRVVADNGEARVRLQLFSIHGSFVTFLDPEFAMQISDAIHNAAKGSNIVIPNMDMSRMPTIQEMLGKRNH